VFLAPAKQGRFVEATAEKAARFRDATRLPDGKSLLALSTESGELEVWKVPANGIGLGERLTTDGTVLRWEVIPSQDGKLAVHQDKNNQLWLLDLSAKTQKKIATGDPTGNSGPSFHGVTWSPDSRWIAWSAEAGNLFEQISIYSVESNAITPVTTDRYNSFDPAWSADGKWLYFLSDRALKSIVRSPWSSRAPDPYFESGSSHYLGKFVCLFGEVKASIRQLASATPQIYNPSSFTAAYLQTFARLQRALRLLGSLR
jgi:tricorn protease